MGLLSTIGAASARAYGFTRSAVSAAVDAYFNRVTLLLNTSSTNGAQNNTFLDSSSNNFSITRNPTSGPNAPTQGTFTPFSQTGWSNYFDDSSIKTSTAAVALGTSEFSIEAFIYLIDDSGNGWTGNRTSAGSNEFSSRMTDTAISIGNSSSGTYNSQLATGTLSSMKNKWVHVAICRSSGTTSIFVDGTRQATTSTSINWSSSRNFAIGFDYSDTTTVNWTGYISNYRMVTGASAYNAGSSTITVPTSILSAITSTKILTSQSNRFVDNSGNSYEFTITGTPRVQAFSPFAPTAAYDTTTVGGSGYFDGTGDYLSLASNTAFNIFGGDMTVEFWFYQTATTNTSQHLLAFVETSTSRVSIYFSAANTLSFWSNGGTTGATRISATSIVPNTWYHYALVKSGSTFTMYINGVSVGTSTTTAYSTANQLLRIATYDGTVTNDNFMGYISSIRIIKGQALTSGAFTPPTAPVTTSSIGWTGANVASSITGTVSLLASFTNAGIYDSASKNLLETVADAQVSTTQAKWGTTSIKFDGTGDWLNIPTTVNITLGSGDFTLEGWIYLNSVTGTQIIFDQRPASTQGVYPVLYMNADVMTWYISTAARITSSALSANTWYHFAVARSGSSTKMFINGTQAGSTYTDTNNYLASRSYIGISAFDQTGGLNGYIDDFRLTKGYARYTANFTAPTAAFPLQ